jgi:hypothetical protein
MLPMTVAAARTLGSWVGIPLKEMDVCVSVFVLSSGLAMGRSTVQCPCKKCINLRTKEMKEEKLYKTIKKRT